MIRQFLLTLYICLLCLTTIAQTEISKITPEQLKNLNIKGREIKKISKDTLKLIINEDFYIDEDELWSQSHKRRFTNFGRTPYGIYLEKITSKNQTTYYQLLQAPSFSVKTIYTDKDLFIIIKDSNGINVNNASFELKGPKPKYIEEITAYKLSNYQKSGYIIIDYADDFYVIQTNDKPQYGYYYNNTRLKKLIQTIGSSKALIKRSILKTRLLFSSQNFFNYCDKNRYKLYGLRPRNQYKSSAYFFETSKPKYKPNDTLKLKFTYPKRMKSLRKKEIFISINQTNENKIEDRLKFIRKGVYTYSLPLNDSSGLEVGRPLEINIREKKRHKTNFQRNRYILRELYQNKVNIEKEVDYSNYKLKHIALKVTAPKTLIKGEKHTYKVSVIDENDKYIFGTKARIVVAPQRCSKMHEKIVYVKDTLLDYRLKLSNNSPTFIQLPDSIFPNADYEYSVNIFATTPDYQTKSYFSTINYSKKNEHCIPGLSVSLDSSLFKPNDEINTLTLFSTNDTLELTSSYVNRSIIQLSTLGKKLPVTFAIDDNDSIIHIETNTGCSTVIKVPEIQLNPFIIETDSFISFNVNNSHNIRYNFFLYEGEKLIYKGEQSYDSIIQVEPRKYHLYSLYFFYLWKGKLHKKKLEYFKNPGELVLNTKHPKKVNPGEEIEVEISIRDAEGNPIKNTDILAYAFTSKFEQKPNLIDRQAIKKYVGKKFHYLDCSPPVFEEESYTEYENWEQVLSLDTSFAYNFLYTDSIYHKVLEKEDVDTAISFAPYICSKGELESIYYILVDNSPVYIANMSNFNYDFNVSKGKHRLTIRTEKRLIDIKGINFNKPGKHILSINPLLSRDSCWMVEMSSKIQKEDLFIYDYIMRVQFPKPHSVGENYIQNGNNIFYQSENRNTYEPNQTYYFGPVTNLYSKFYTDSSSYLIKHKPNTLFNLHNNHYEVHPVSPEESIVRIKNKAIHFNSTIADIHNKNFNKKYNYDSYGLMNKLPKPSILFKHQSLNQYLTNQEKLNFNERLKSIKTNDSQEFHNSSSIIIKNRTHDAYANYFLISKGNQTKYYSKYWWSYAKYGEYMLYKVLLDSTVLKIADIKLKPNTTILVDVSKADTASNQEIKKIRDIILKKLKKILAQKTLPRKSY